MIYSSDVVISGFYLDVRVDVSQCIGGSVDFALANLIRLEEESVHVGQLHFVVVEKYQLRQIEICYFSNKDACLSKQV